MEAKNNYHTGQNAVVSYVSHQRNVVESTERSMTLCLFARHLMTLLYPVFVCHVPLDGEQWH